MRGHLALGSGDMRDTFAAVIRRAFPAVLCVCISAVCADAQDAPRPAVVAYPKATKPGVPAAAPALALAPAPTPAPASVAKPAAPDPGLQPSWETQKLARNYIFAIPPPRGQITDRNGLPLAQSRIGYNLAINFPVPPRFSEEEASRFIAEHVRHAQDLTGRKITVDPAKALKQYKERAVLPMVIAQDLKPAELERLKRGQAQAPGLTTIPVYLRTYPQGTSAAHVLGFVGRQGGFPSGEIENNELLWPEFEGRDGIEKSFNTQLTGKLGMMQVSFDARGQKATEKVTLPPRPGQNVVMSIDLKIQQVVERALRAVPGKRPCAMVVMDPRTGEILAMASEPAFDPNIYIPSVSPEVMDKLTTDPFNPLFPRAYRAAYPPGSIFKIITGLAAMNDGYVDPDDAFGGEAAIKIGGTTFRNWKHSDVGPLNFREALIQSCNTYFYKMGLKSGYRPILDYGSRLGLGAKTGIPVSSEEPGNLMTLEYMQKHHGRGIMPGDIANMSIGQGDTLVTPVQMASAMCAIANGGTVFQPRLVLQVQDLDGRITFGYDARVRSQIDIHRDTMKALRAGLDGVVNSGGGTAGRAGVPGFKVVGKTGTAQWGPKKREKVAAWFVGFAPLDKPQYAFAVLYEGKPGDNDVHGGTYAAPIAGRVLKEILKAPPKEDKKAVVKKKPVDPDESN